MSKLKYEMRDSLAKQTQLHENCKMVKNTNDSLQENELKISITPRDYVFAVI